MPARPAAAFLVLALAAAGGCGSRNEGKIVGRWKAPAAAFGQQVPAGAVLDYVYEFAADGSFKVVAVSPVYAATGGGKLVRSGKYALGAGDEVTLTGMNPPVEGKTTSKERITIVGDLMTIAAADGKSVVMTRVAD